ncbi:TetR/AcrR family transcriptional regulator [Nonomuraea sp. PA05]|uniref:TetR/AcrR family transcriptional regulator n=1 Tax=Nonomuraea sp. PA05 TaxID=2604466 RepID=UPI0011DBD8AC|nr:TetR family transcriptional regulator [Nonomuraea sp. PA05]TYB50542.1 TetR/AcrR family transcriptional regulator [Nonomuraea sp. PA05]
MSTFQRARSEEQRELRRRTILDTAAAMLDEMPVAEVSLNELSRRVGLAKSNVLRYFESREAVLLELLDRAWKQWIDDLPARMAAEVGEDGPAGERGDRLAAVLTRSLQERQVLCDLLGAQAGVLERNVSADLAGHFKRTAIGNVDAMARLARQHLPELGDHAWTLCAQAIMAAAAAWTHARPSAAMLAAYDADPSLAVLRMDFAPTLQDLLSTLVAGTLARAAVPREGA